MWNRHQRYRHEYQYHRNSHEETSDDASNGSNYDNSTRLICKIMTNGYALTKPSKSKIIVAPQISSSIGKRIYQLYHHTQWWEWVVGQRQQSYWWSHQPSRRDGRPELMMDLLVDANNDDGDIHDESTTTNANVDTSHNNNTNNHTNNHEDITTQPLSST